MKKSVLGIILTITVLMGLLAGCGTTNQQANNQSTAQNNESSKELQKEAGKTLIVYYSAQGHTKTFAEAIAKETGADTFEIIPSKVYTDADLDWTNSSSRVSKEHDDESLRNIELTTTTVENWDSYDTVFIGYPIWWGIAAWPVDNFVKANDFTGKTVIPFCTAVSSGIGESGELLYKMAGTGVWKEGIRFQQDESTDSVKKALANIK